MKHLIPSITLSIVATIGLQACGNSQNDTAQNSDNNDLSTLQGDLKEQNYFLVIEQTATNPDKYVLAERHPTNGETRAVLKKLDGSEVIMSHDELKALAEAEAKKVENGTSALTQEASAEAASSGLGLGEMILASAAGALIGGMLANKLSQNDNFRQHQQAATKPEAAISKSAEPRPKPSLQQPTKSTSQTQKRKGFSFGSRKRR